MTIEILHLLMKRPMREHLIPWEGKVFTIVPQPINFKADFASKFNEDGNASQEGCGATCLQDDHVGVHEKRGLTQHVGIEVTVGYTR
mmetsp:Transcript_19272/g.29088  ORF Transcript_19272/g.29088 Transcript_19272/m.29088 type:complete len:87 (+) Transcript_19272:885-1145(+)